MERVRGIAASAWGFVQRALDGPRWKWALALAGLALIARVPFLLGDFSTAITPDAPTYLQIAEGLPGSADTNAYRTLGYPLFVAPFTLIPWDVSAGVYGTAYEFPAALILVQHLIGIGLAAAVFWVTDRYFGRWPAIFAGLITAFAPPMAMVEHFILPDFLFGVLVFAGAVALIEAVLPDKPSLRGLVLAGVVFGLAAHVKPSAQVLIVVAPFVLAFATRSWRETWRGALVVGGVMVAVILPWIAHNGIRYDQWTMSVQGGQALWLRVFDQDKLPIPTDSEEGVRANELYHSYLEDPPPEYAQNPETLAETESYTYVFNELGQEMSMFDAIAIQRDLAIQAILDHPKTYLRGTAVNVKDYGRLNAAPHGFAIAEEVALGQIGPDVGATVRKLSTGAWKLADLLVRAGFIASLALFAILLLVFVGPRRSRVAAVGFLVTWFAIAIAGSLTASVLPRYAAQIAPLQWILEAAAAVFVVTAVIDLVRRRRAERPEPAI